MHERSLEILVRHCVRSLFSQDWEIVAQQLALARGRLDLLAIDANGVRHVLELKRGRATPAAIEQAISYVTDLRTSLGSDKIRPWVVAHEIPSAVRLLAEARGVRTLGISEARCEELIAEFSLGSDIMLGPRIGGKILHGGTGLAGMWQRVENTVAFGELPTQTALSLRTLEKHRDLSFHSGKMQIALHYRGVKLGGINRSHKHFYISDGVVVRDDFAASLSNLGFILKRKPSSQHEHIWWQLSWDRVEDFVAAIALARQVVDQALRIGDS